MQKERENVNLPGKKTEDAEAIEDTDLLRQVDGDTMTSKRFRIIIAGVYILLILMGVGTGAVLSGSAGTRTVSAPSGGGSAPQSGTIVGINDTKTFKDSAVGILEKGGIDGEGTHKLIREGGPSQTAYLLSSVIDLDRYVGKKVKVWGQTIAAQKASWLMDVGKIEVQQ
ncbi:hypothetical protein M1555_00675 [Patescibacteria group bacterium]|nr:hypothetical protein [Patescibacteria group bacterium]